MDAIQTISSVVGAVGGSIAIFAAVRAGIKWLKKRRTYRIVIVEDQPVQIAQLRKLVSQVLSGKVSMDAVTVEYRDPQLDRYRHRRDIETRAYVITRTAELDEAARRIKFGFAVALSKDALALYPLFARPSVDIPTLLFNFVLLYGSRAPTPPSAAAFDVYAKLASGEQIVCVLDLDENELEMLMNSKKASGLEIFAVPGFASMSDLDGRIIVNKLLPKILFKAAHCVSFDWNKDIPLLFSKYDWEMGLH